MKSIYSCLFPDGNISWIGDCAGLAQGIMQTKVSWRLDHSYLQVTRVGILPLFNINLERNDQRNYEH